MEDYEYTPDAKDGRVVARQAREAEIMHRLSQLGGDQMRDESVVFEGRRLVIPETMTAKDAVDFLRAKITEDEEHTVFTRTFPFRPWDGAAIAYAAFRDVFGSVMQESRWFDPALAITVPIGAHGETVSVPFGGTFSVPLLPDVSIAFGATNDEEHGQIFTISAGGPRKHRYAVEGLFAVVAEALKTSSLYRGQAIDGRAMPNFIDLDAVDPSSVIYTEDVRTQLEANVWTPIRHAKSCREAGVPLKRAVLIHGPFGTGKTLAAMLTARIATENGWTFLYARPGRDDLLDVMRTARLYQPAVVFFEDADVIADASREDSDGVSILLDAFDGITSKGTELIAVLTTNYPEKIHKGMVRPGRLDAVVRIAELDPRGVREMIEKNAGSMLADDLDWDAIGAAFEGFLPAFCREAIDRAVRYALARSNGNVGAIVLDAEDFIAAANGLRPQLQLMEEAPEHEGRVTVDGLTRRYAAEAARDALRETLPEVLIPQVIRPTV